MPDVQADSEGLRRLSKEQKVGFILLLAFAVLTVGLGILQIRNSLYAPFALNNTVPTVLKSDVVDNIDALRLRDTDHDELADFDELYVYGTSPYLYDTFSYGMSDKDVIAKGLPLCPKGQDCTGVAVAGEGVPTSTSGTVTALAPGDAPPDLLKILRDPAQIRKMLLDNGIDKKALDKVSDEQLLEFTSQTLNSSSTLQSLQAISGAIRSSTQR